MKKEARFTPGPWKSHDWRVVDCQGKGGICTTVICDTANNNKTRTPENRANALLIAAAPELLEACKGLSDMCSHAWELMDGGLTVNESSIQRFEGAHRKADEAIRKALGEL